MNKVNKIDYYSGAFLSYLNANGTEPTVLGGTEKCKVIRLSVHGKDYKVYLKYVGKPRMSTIKKKTFFNWETSFTTAERDYLKSDFSEYRSENIVVIVCTTETFDYTCFAVVPVEDALKCLGNDCINQWPRITIRRQKNGRHIKYHGTTIADRDAKKLTDFGFDH